MALLYILNLSFITFEFVTAGICMVYIYFFARLKTNSNT